MKKIAIKKLLVAMAIATATNISFAQTPYDSFAPSSEKKEMLKLPEVTFKSYNTDTTNKVKYIELDIELLTMSYRGVSDSLIAEVQLKPTDFKWWSVDPRASKYPGWSPYNFAVNNPILYIDPNGDTVRVYSNSLNEDGSKYLLFTLDNGKSEFTDYSYNQFRSSGLQWYSKNLDNYAPMLSMNPNLVKDGKAIGITAQDFANTTNQVRRDLHNSTSYKWFGWGNSSIYNNFNHGEQGDIKADGKLLDGYQLTVYTGSNGQQSLVRSDLLGNFLFGFMAEEHGQTFQTSRSQGDFLQSEGVDDQLDTYFLLLGHQQRASSNTIPNTFNNNAVIPAGQ